MSSADFWPQLYNNARCGLPSLRNSARAAQLSGASASKSVRSAAAPSGWRRSHVRATALAGQRPRTSGRGGRPAAAARRRPAGADACAISSERQSQLFSLSARSCSSYQSSAELQPLVDDDVAEAMAALAATYETAARGVIYEHRPASLPAERLVGALKPVLAEGRRRRRHARSSATPPSCCAASQRPCARCARPTRAIGARSSTS